MKKRLVVALCSTLGVATALPASALTNEITGFFRVRGIMGDISFGKDQTPDSFVDQRFRAKWTMGLNDYIKLVYFGEVDFQWGDQTYAGRNEGGGIGGDAANVETKNLYAEVKIPNTPVTATLGLQGYADNFDWVIFNNDFAGAKFAGKIGKVDANVAWFKFNEESFGTVNAPGGSNNYDDVDMYSVQTSMKPMDALKVGADFYFINNAGTRAQSPTTSFQNSDSGVNDTYYQQRDEQLYYLGVNGSYKLPMATISGWALYNFGVMKNVKPGDLSQLAADEPNLALLKGSSAGNYFGKETHNVNVSAWAATVKADLAPAPGLNAMVRALVFSSDDDATDTDQNYLRVPTYSSENPGFLRDGLIIFLPDAMACTYPATPGNALQDAAYKGYGLAGLVATAAYVPPTMKQMYVKGALGAFQAMNKKTTVGAWVDGEWVEGDLEREGKFLGTELAARVGYVFAEKFDVSLNGSYAFLGSFYDNTVLKDGKSRPASGPKKGMPINGSGSQQDSESIINKMPLGDAGTNPDNPYMVYLMATINY